MVNATEREINLTDLRNSHGEYYIKIFKGRNLVRLCRICSGKFESDRALTDHIVQWHPINIFANTNVNEDQIEEQTLACPVPMEDFKVSATMLFYPKDLTNINYCSGCFN